MRNRADLENGPHPSDLDEVVQDDIPNMHCYICCPEPVCPHQYGDAPTEKVEKSRVSTADPLMGPTEVYDLACGHTII